MVRRRDTADVREVDGRKRGRRDLQDEHNYGKGWTLEPRQGGNQEKIEERNIGSIPGMIEPTRNN
eukprot:6188718-Pleurochrysis_carterae.AAC.1